MISCKSLMDRIFDETEELFVNLFSRWMDERDYEDINEYGAAMRKRIEQYGVKFLKMEKRPFGYVYQIHATKVRVSITRSGKYSYRSF